MLVICVLDRGRSFGMSFVQYTYLTTEFRIRDERAGLVIGIQSWFHVGFGVVGALLVDTIGVRMVALVALSVGAVSRGMVAFTRSPAVATLTLLTLTPFGEALLTTGLYGVSLKKLTHSGTRPIVFALQYALHNLAGAFVDLGIDLTRTRNFEFTLPLPAALGGAQPILWSGLRTWVVFTWVLTLVCLGATACFVHDLELVPVLADAAAAGAHGSDLPAVPSRPQQEPPPVAPQRSHSLPSRGGLGPGHGEDEPQPEPQPVRYVVVPSRVGAAAVAADAPGSHTPAAAGPRTWPVSVLTRALCRDARAVGASARELLRLRAFGRAVAMSLMVAPLAKLWVDMDTILPAYLERFYGEGVPIFRIHSINLWGCATLPPVVAALSAHRESLSVMLPGMWLMALSTLPLVLAPSVPAAAAWMTLQTAGEVLWAPRFFEWLATLAPRGREAIFLAGAGMMREVISRLPAALNGVLLAAYSPNCTRCRDAEGHFCASRDAGAGAGLAACRSISSVCAGEGFATSLAHGGLGGDCPSSCPACPGWAGDARALFIWLLGTSLLTPVLVTLFLPFLRGRGCAWAGRVLCLPDVDDDDESAHGAGAKAADEAAVASATGGKPRDEDRGHCSAATSSQKRASPAPSLSRHHHETAASAANWSSRPSTTLLIRQQML